MYLFIYEFIYIETYIYIYIFVLFKMCVWVFIHSVTQSFIVLVYSVIIRLFIYYFIICLLFPLFLGGGGSLPFKISRTGSSMDSLWLKCLSACGIKWPFSFQNGWPVKGRLNFKSHLRCQWPVQLATKKKPKNFDVIPR